MDGTLSCPPNPLPIEPPRQPFIERPGYFILVTKKLKFSKDWPVDEITIEKLGRENCVEDFRSHGVVEEVKCSND